MKDRKYFYEGNDLMARFDGIEVIGHDKDFGVVYDIPNLYPFYKMDHDDNTGSIGGYIDWLDYHFRWDWLMPIIKKDQ